MKKNKTFIVIMALLILFLFCSTLSACGNADESYQISYEMNGGTNNSSNPTSYTSETETITLFVPTRRGFSFVKWSEGDTITSGSVGDKTFTAEWTKDEYTITYVLNDGLNDTNNPTSYDVESATITLQNPSKIGYTFVKWTEGNTIETGSIGNKIFTAEWRLITYLISYNLNGGT